MAPGAGLCAMRTQRGHATRVPGFAYVPDMLDQYDETTFEHDAMTRRLFVRGEGPGIVVMHLFAERSKGG
jgi:hypothetical protein